MICIVSPHLDDAAMSCADHALGWVAARQEVLVLNVFTGAGEPGPCSTLMAANLRAAGVASAEQYTELRRGEDARCLQALGLQACDLGLSDAGFRGQGGRPDYDSLVALRPGRLGPREQPLVDELSHRLPQLQGASLVLCPMGVGGHVDHLIARAACERVVEPGRLAYYADMPYARAPWNWARTDWARLARARWSVKAMTAAKRAALAHYQSQTPLLFGRCSYCPELLLLPAH
nr:PIG-L family deacetylase [uncultured Roseateles sp.]